MTVSAQQSVMNTPGTLILSTASTSKPLEKRGQVRYSATMPDCRDAPVFLVMVFHCTSFSAGTIANRAPPMAKLIVLLNGIVLRRR